ncbi:hypothetical protein BJX64DRAFT_263537 [Aspergillus heterothallicus]
MADENSDPPAYSEPSPDPPPYDLTMNPTQPIHQPLRNPRLMYNTFPRNYNPRGSESESGTRRCRVNYELLAVLFFVVVVGSVILLPGLQGHGLGSRQWIPTFPG